jgi:TonB family protein
VFYARSGHIENKVKLDAGAVVLHRMMLVLEKSNRRDGDLAELTDYLKRAYVREHLSMPQDLLDVDSYVKSTPPRLVTTHHACANPNVEATVTKSVQPDYPQSAKDIGIGPVTVEVAVAIGPTGDVLGAKVYKSSNNMAIDQAALSAARESTYSPKLVHCQPTQGDYFFRADFQPD